MDAARSELAEAGRRQAQIDGLISECNEKLAKLHKSHTREGVKAVVEAAAAGRRRTRVGRTRSRTT